MESVAVFHSSYSKLLDMFQNINVVERFRLKQLVNDFTIMCLQITIASNKQVVEVVC